MACFLISPLDGVDIGGFGLFLGTSRRTKVGRNTRERIGDFESSTVEIARMTSLQKIHPNPCSNHPSGLDSHH